MEIVPGIHQIKLPLKDNPIGYVNTYLIEGKPGWTLIDTGWNDEESFEALQSGLSQIGLGLADIELIIVTHMHPDHFGLAGRIKKAAGARLAIHEVEKAFLDSREAWMTSLFQEMGRWLVANGVPAEYVTLMENAPAGAMEHVTADSPDTGLEDREQIRTGVFELEVLWTPGHSPGHVCLYERRKRILFTGDHVLPVTTPNISIHLETDRDPLGEYLRSLERIRDLDVMINLPAHEEPFSNLDLRIRELLVHHDERKREIMETVTRQPKTAFDIASEITWMEGQMSWDEMSPLDRRIAVTEALAHLEALRRERRLERLSSNAVYHYAAKVLAGDD